MPDQNNNDSFERFFQKKADEYEIIYNEDDWNQLEGRLDVLDEKRLIAKKRFLAGAAVFLIFSLLSYFTYKNYLTINELQQQLSSQSVQPAQPNLEQGAENSTNDSPQNAIETFERTIAAQDDEESRPEPSTESSFLPPATDENEIASFVSTDALERITADDLAEKKLPRSNFVAQHSIGLQDIDPVKPVNTEPLFASRMVTSSSGPAQNDATQTLASRFSVGLSMAPDFSTVGSFSNFYSPGYKIGAYLEYKISSNFGISVGLIHSTVRYTAGKGEYSPPYSYWANGITPSQTLAECILIDIPIKLKYNFMNFDRSRFYATAGIASYIMLNEAYEFDYSANEAGLPQSWNGKTGTRHWMSNAGFSIGYEFDITPMVSIRAEPFIRIPLKEIGWGNVKLYSTGTFISFNYNFR